MDTECEQPENDDCDSNCALNVAVNVESEQMECSSISDDSNEFSMALMKAKGYKMVG